MTLDDFTKPNLGALLGFGVLAAALPAILPQLRPVITSAIRLGIALYEEAEGEAEAELIQSLVSATLHEIRDVLAQPAGERERRDAVRHRVNHFKRQAHGHARRWAASGAARERSYHRTVASLEARLAHRKERAPPAERDAIEDAFVALADPG